MNIGPGGSNARAITRQVLMCSLPSASLKGLQRQLNRILPSQAQAELL